MTFIARNSLYHKVDKLVHFSNITTATILSTLAAANSLILESDNHPCNGMIKLQGKFIPRPSAPIKSCLVLLPHNDAILGIRMSGRIHTSYLPYSDE